MIDAALRPVEAYIDSLGMPRFPLDVAAVALGFSASAFPGDPIVDVKGDDLPGLEGGLFKVARGWTILFNANVRSEGRRRFTLAHEFGHYLLHRVAFPNGIVGGQDNGKSSMPWRRAEREANAFAANLLMPLGDFSARIGTEGDVTARTFDDLSELFGVSRTAAALRWIECTEVAAILVASRDGFALWSRSSAAAARKAFTLRTAGAAMEMPLAASTGATAGMVREHGPGVWAERPVREIALGSDRNDVATSVLILR